MLAQLLQLCPPNEETTLFFKSAFLQRLPAAVRMQLTEDRNSPVQALAARADALMLHHNTSTVAPIQLDGNADFITAVSGSRPPGKKAPARPQPAQSSGGKKQRP